MTMPTQDAPQRPIDSRVRYYRLSTPDGVAVVVGLAAAGEPVTITVAQPSPAVLILPYDEAWALWACLADGLGVAGEPPAWVPEMLDPTDIEHEPLPSLGVPDRPF
ncbi:hypothetical protein [Nonomuraea sediminis]|uniref:hypothetical protein n=1 Tax=Nonomuraea sediminis TaxID=2835864 RepID=UPI001BDDC7B6|nr:hypothetical protein [Nonomuraea sediminis]